MSKREMNEHEHESLATLVRLAIQYLNLFAHRQLLNLIILQDRIRGTPQSLRDPNKQRWAKTIDLTWGWRSAKRDRTSYRRTETPLEGCS